MSIFDTAKPATATPIISRRLFAKRSIGAMAATAALGFGAASAQDVGVTPEQVTLQERVATDTTAESATQEYSGQFIVDFALAFVGYPYVWAGNTPSGFDCSGFTQYVILNTLGIDIGHGTAGQMNYGTWVDAGNLLPGDLVYFAGTYGDGISHTGVYIGDGQFVHAENEGTGVTISALWSNYYGGHYYGAIRLW